MALVGNAAASREEELRRLMPPPPPRPPSVVAAPTPKQPIVLDEDTYTQQLESIIERDYFPELPKMVNQLEWLRAVNSGDVREIQRAQRNIARRRAAATAAVVGATPEPALGANKTPGTLPPFHTPGTGAGWATATPGTGLLRTPAMTPTIDGSETGGADTVIGSAGAGVTLGQTAAPTAELSLDAFLSRFTSEDNASFQAILQEDNRRKRAKVRHHLERPDPRDPETRRLLLEGPKDRPSDEYGTTGQAPMTLLPAPEPVINSLFYDSSQRPEVPHSAKELAELSLGPPKEINKMGTRLKAPPAAAAAAGAPIGAPMPGGLVGTVGYAPVRTPALEDVLASPLMTWGDIESTPLRLGADDMPVAIDLEALMGAGPSFRVQGLTEREQAAHRLAAAKAGSGTAAGRAVTGHGSTPLLTALRRATGTGGGASATARAGGGSGTPLAVPLSPAARQLAANIKAGLTPRTATVASGGGGGSRGGYHGHHHRSGSGRGGGAGNSMHAAPAAAAAAAGKTADLGHGELDKQLRASYRSAAVASLGRHGGTPTMGMHPRTHTPAAGGSAGRAATAGVTPGGGGNGRRSAPKVVGAGKRELEPPTGTAGAAGADSNTTLGSVGKSGGSVTDNLLNL
ncbi:hypothetical protein Vretimale_6448 [Volvox reticuliferus]|uniref:Nuclear protein Es2 n=1 Tax=Volvox reticuliferus TaxID=1737510 RepID=A0A8J4G7H2_9CHLO|nr:hypothetical protein Vretifemale_19911 [Volvox reticuliferus]GIM01713.1 hypothetical protein Vretimale_6448 [Volvox reticuliferus]